MSINISELNQMDGRQFEDLIEKLIQKMGFITKERDRSADGGIDIFALNQQPILEGDYVIQCKRYSKPIDVSIIRDLYGVVHSKNANKGILITNSTFSKPAEEFAKGKQLELIEGDELIRLLVKYEVFTPSDVIYDFPKGYRVLQFSLMNSLTSIIKKMEDYKAGLIFVNKKEITEQRWIDLISEETNRFLDYGSTMMNIVNQFGPLINSSSDEDMKKIQDLSKYIIDANKTLLKNYEKMYTMAPPTIWLEAHEAWLKIYESFIEDWGLFKNKFESVLESPPEDGFVDLTLLFKDDAVENYNRIFDETQKKVMPKSGCFIVTAAYGSPMAKEVDVFRHYRDEVLLTNEIGRRFVSYYYKISPFYANLIENSNLVRRIIRKIILTPIIKCLQMLGYDI